jgi:hypothetical protein
MKKIFSIFSVMIMTTLMWSCSDDEGEVRMGLNSDDLTGKASLVLTAPTVTSGTTYYLDRDNPTTAFETFTTTSAVADASAVSQYYLEVTTTDKTFDKGQVVGPFTTPSFSVTNQQLNDIFIALGKNEAADLRMRVRQDVTLGDMVGTYYSPVMTHTIVGWYDLYAVGGGLKEAGWGWGTPVVLKGNKGVFKTTAPVTFVTDDEGPFRFFLQKNWNPTSYNYPYYADKGFKIDTKLAKRDDGDKNFKYIGTTGTKYNITIDYVNKTITLTP